jgi:flagellar biosynthetic protein FliQ
LQLHYKPYGKKYRKNGQNVTPEEVITFGREAIYVMLRLSLPLLISGLVVGLIVALFQALTQIQEQTLTFIPKIVVVFLLVLVMMPFMGRTMGGFMALITDQIITIG